MSHHFISYESREGKRAHKDKPVIYFLDWSPTTLLWPVPCPGNKKNKQTQITPHYQMHLQMQQQLPLTKYASSELPYSHFSSYLATLPIDNKGLQSFVSLIPCSQSWKQCRVLLGSPLLNWTPLNILAQSTNAVVIHHPNEKGQNATWKYLLWKL